MRIPVLTARAGAAHNSGDCHFGGRSPWDCDSVDPRHKWFQQVRDCLFVHVSPYPGRHPVVVSTLLRTLHEPDISPTRYRYKYTSASRKVKFSAVLGLYLDRASPIRSGLESASHDVRLLFETHQHGETWQGPRSGGGSCWCGR